MKAIWKRELTSLFHNVIAWLFLGVTLFLFGLYFFVYNLSYGYPYIAYSLSAISFIFLITVPVLTMRVLAEERRARTDQLLLTSPVNITGIVVGKYLAAFVVYMIGVSCTILFQIILATFATPDWNVFLGNYLALALIGAALIAIGIFISSLTENQIVAAIGTFAITLFIWMFDTLASVLPTGLSFLATILNALSFSTRYNDFVSGILDLSHILFFLSFAVVFLFLTIRVLEKKRWS